MTTRKPLVLVDGALVPWEKATLHVSTHSFLYGTAVFEGERAYWDDARQRLAAFELDAHSKRLARNAGILGIRAIPDAETLSDWTLQLLAANAFTSDVYIRPVIYIGEGSIGIFPSTQETHTVIFATPFNKYFGKDTPLAVKTSTWVRLPSNVIPPNAKVNGAYVNSYLATKEAKDAGYDEALMLSIRGYVSEGPGENFWVVHKGKLVTPPLSEDILDGITREHVMDLAADLGIEVLERSIGRTEVYTADEAFFSGTGVEISPIGRIDHVEIGTGKLGPITRQIQERFHASVRGQIPEHMDKLSYVPEVCALVPP
ncbi:MAG: branched-chain amino acid transaminase [Thermoplasmatota archaeon]